MSEAEQKLLALIKDRAFKRGTFRLASGGTSDYYIDGKMIEVFSQGAYLIGEVIYEHTQDIDFDAIGGLEVGAVPLTTAAVISYHLHGREMEGFWVRDSVKTHGTQKITEGGLKAGSRVVILDDVITQGGSALKAIQEVQKRDCQVVLVLSLVDRLRGAEELFRQHGMANYRSVFTVRDLGVSVATTENQQPVAKPIAEQSPQKKPRVPGNCKGMITLLVEDDEHLKDFEEYMQ